MRGLNEEVNIYQQMHERGEGITFDNEGVPMVYKQSKSSKQLVDCIDF